MAYSMNNPMHGAHRAICGALTRQRTPCKTSPMKNGRCRMHGGKSTGAPKGNQNALKHGRYSDETKQIQNQTASLYSAFVEVKSYL